MYNQAKYGDVDVITGDYLAGTEPHAHGLNTRHELNKVALHRGQLGQ